MSPIVLINSYGGHAFCVSDSRTDGCPYWGNPASTDLEDIVWVGVALRLLTRIWGFEQGPFLPNQSLQIAEDLQLWGLIRFAGVHGLKDSTRVTQLQK